MYSHASACQEICLWQGKQLILESGFLSPKAQACVSVRMGDAYVLCSVVVGDSLDPFQGDFLPFSVFYQEKMFAAGRIPGGYIKREGKPNEREMLVSRLIDRAFRPLFPATLTQEVQLFCTVLSHDISVDPSLLAFLGSSAALNLAGIPLEAPLAATRVVLDSHNKPVISWASGRSSDQEKLQLVMAGTSQHLMAIEATGKEVDKEILKQAIRFGQSSLEPLLDCLKRFQGKVAHLKRSLPDTALLNPKQFQEALKGLEHLFCQWYQKHKTKSKKKIRIQDVSDAIEAWKAFYPFLAEGKVQHDHGLSHPMHIKKLLHSFEKKCVTQAVIRQDKRLDGRSTKAIRPLYSRTAELPRSHGSSLFTRGGTQVMGSVILGGKEESQAYDSLNGDYRESFLLHYNFPSWSVGEVGRASGPGRREIGHGRLAWNALMPLLPSQEVFPYTIRYVAEVLSSDGSSSMATVCAGSLALMDAGVLIPRHIAGIAMGLFQDEGAYRIVSDLTGSEDALGCMDYKIAGTEKGITALQLDVKSMISREILEETLDQAWEGISHILDHMHRIIDQPKATSDRAPQMGRLRISSHRIRDLIGQGGRVIRSLCEETKSKIHVEDQGMYGRVKIVSQGAASLSNTIRRIQDILGEQDIFLDENNAAKTHIKADEENQIKPTVKSNVNQKTENPDISSEVALHLKTSVNRSSQKNVAISDATLIGALEKDQIQAPKQASKSHAKPVKTQTLTEKSTQPGLDQSSIKKPARSSKTQKKEASSFISQDSSFNESSSVHRKLKKPKESNASHPNQTSIKPLQDSKNQKSQAQSHKKNKARDSIQSSRSTSVAGSPTPLSSETHQTKTTKTPPVTQKKGKTKSFSGKIGQIYQAKITRVTSQGLLISCLGFENILIHNADIFREPIKGLGNFFREGEDIMVRFIQEVDGQPVLSMKDALLEKA